MMICYKDRTYCGAPHCDNTCGKHITPAEIQEAASLGLLISYAYFCGEEEQSSENP
jgi:hypothetical protein